MVALFRNVYPQVIFSSGLFYPKILRYSNIASKLHIQYNIEAEVCTQDILKKIPTNNNTPHIKLKNLIRSDYCDR